MMKTVFQLYNTSNLHNYLFHTWYYILRDAFFLLKFRSKVCKYMHTTFVNIVQAKWFDIVGFLQRNNFKEKKELGRINKL